MRPLHPSVVRTVAFALVVTAIAVVAGPARPAAAAVPPPPVYRPPVERPVVDGFRPPPNPFGPGNRGIDYGTSEGEPVAASADGDVVFAGRVGLSLHVVVLHADGLRTSYSFLASIAVRRGDHVVAGQVVGTAGGALHFGVRAGEVYLDPSLLFAGAPEVHLVPIPRPGRTTEADEAGHLSSMVRTLRRAAGVGAAAVAWARGTGTGFVRRAAGSARSAVALAAAASPTRIPGDTVDAVADWWAQRGRCTSRHVHPPRLVTRHRVVLVAGLGSASGSGAVLDVDTAALGYRPEDVTQFSYRGGTTKDNPYDADDTQNDIRESGRRLRELLERMQREEPGVTVDVIAHSQGGLVTRVALEEPTPRPPTDPRLPPLGAVVTLGTPHHGADLASGLDRVGDTPVGKRVEGLLDASGVSNIHPRSKSVQQLAVGSSFLDDLNATPVPAGVHITSIAGRGDAIVPSPRAHLDGAENVIVTVPGIATDHDHLPGSPAAQREIALAVAGMPPTCQTLGDAVVDGVTGGVISRGELSGGVLVAGGTGAAVP